MNQTPTGSAIVRSGLFVPLFDELADPVAVARLAAEAEEAGWDGFFVWDQVRWRPPVLDVADPWITLAVIATDTTSIRLGPLVTPLARRRPVKVARETATLDHLSLGRLTLGVGLGSDHFASEYSMTGEEVDDRRRARMLDESLKILTAAWSGEHVNHKGEHYTVGGMRFLPGRCNDRGCRSGSQDSREPQADDGSFSASVGRRRRQAAASPGGSPPWRCRDARPGVPPSGARARACGCPQEDVRTPPLGLQGVQETLDRLASRRGPPSHCDRSRSDRLRRRPVSVAT
jgi:hypothetical protein